MHVVFLKGGGGQNMLTSSEGRLHTVASLTSCCRTLHREGELLRESNSAVREESCLHCCRRRCGRGARLQKGRKGGDPISRQSLITKNALASIMHTEHQTCPPDLSKQRNHSRLKSLIFCESLILLSTREKLCRG